VSQAVKQGHDNGLEGWVSRKAAKTPRTATSKKRQTDYFTTEGAEGAEEDTYYWDCNG